MFQNTDFSYTNSYDEEKMFELLAEIIIKGIKEDTKDPFDVIILDELYCRGILLNGKNAKDIINYYIGHYYKFYKTTSEMDFEMGWLIDPYHWNEDCYAIIAQYLLIKRINNSGIFNYIF